MATITTWFTLGTLGMALGTLVLLYGFRLVPESDRRLYAVVVSIPAIAIVAYGIMASGIGAIVADDHVVYVPRYVDWLLTTPLNVAVLALLAGTDRRTLGTLLGLQALTIAFGFGGSIVTGPATYGLFAVGFACFVGVAYLLYATIAADAEASLSEIEYGLYRTLRNFVIVLWLVYPIIWLVGPPGIGLMDIETASLVITYIDVVTKVGFGLLTLHGLVLISEVSETESATGGDLVETPATPDGSGAD